MKNVVLSNAEIKYLINLIRFDLDWATQFDSEDLHVDILKIYDKDILNAFKYGGSILNKFSKLV